MNVLNPKKKLSPEEAHQTFHCLPDEIQTRIRELENKKLWHGFPGLREPITFTEVQDQELLRLYRQYQVVPLLSEWYPNVKDLVR